MSLATINQILNKASKAAVASGAYNIYALCQIDALVEAHEEMGASLIIQVADPANGFLGGNIDFMNSLPENKKLGAKRAAKKYKSASEQSAIDVCLHLDHGQSIESVKNAIDAGFTSVMYDGSNLSFEENVENTLIAAKIAHQNGVSIEAELGILGGKEDDVKSERSHFTDPKQALRFVQATGVDCLAISYGTQHGANKGKDVKLKIELVKEIKKIFIANKINCPLVSHGSSNVPIDIVEKINNLGGNIESANGISFEELQKAINAGICKINIDTDIRLATTLMFRRYFESEKSLTNSMEEIKKIMLKNPKCFDPRVFLAPIVDKIITEKKKDQEALIIEFLMKNAVREICARTVPVFTRNNKNKI